MEDTFNCSFSKSIKPNTREMHLNIAHVTSYHLWSFPKFILSYGVFLVRAPRLTEAWALFFVRYFHCRFLSQPVDHSVKVSSSFLLFMERHLIIDAPSFSKPFASIQQRWINSLYLLCKYFLAMFNPSPLSLT